ncbi:L-lactate permease [uncultured Paracoccus sp.]|uniref:L-lactate permease n=1 Tax=uncultured Paracoccus sp. TaxID=189685 RepID=UPI002637FD36|nr:L-lactate permease [uncultured Paracoccus sp.]
MALLVMLALSRLMVHSGMTAVLAAAFTSVWPVLAPAVGALGTFITGSATASNILVTELQLTTPAGLSLPPLLMAAAKGFGAAIGNIVTPHNIIAGSATVGLIGREGDILAQTARPIVFYLGIGSVVIGFIACGSPPRAPSRPFAAAPETSGSSCPWVRTALRRAGPGSPRR